MKSKSKDIFVVMRGPSAAIFENGKKLQIEGFQSSLGLVNITYSTRYIKKDNQNILPGDLWIEIRGNAQSLETALSPFANAGLSLLPLITLSANAVTKTPDIELGFDNTSNISERDYFQNFIPPESEIIYLRRKVNIELTISILKSILTNPESERLRRAANQYLLALESWRLGFETLTLAHLWMAVEALTKAKLRSECSLYGISEVELADKMGVELKQLDGIIRKDLILKGDEECYKKSRHASDGFEHGFMGFDKLRQISKDVRPRMAGYVRNSILEMCGLDSQNFTTLTNSPYDKPLGYWAVAKYLRGKLIGSGNDLAKPENAYPFIKWNSSINTSTINEEGNIIISPSETITPELAEGIKFQIQSLEMWKPD